MNQKTPSGSFFANVSIRHTAADAAGSAVWAFRNPVLSLRRIVLAQAKLVMGFDGTAGAGLSLAYELIRFTGGDPTTGVTVPRIKKRSKQSNSAILDANIQQKSGVLTITGGSFEAGPFHVIRLPASVSNGVVESSKIGRGMQFEPGEGLAIRVHSVAAIIGLELSGSVEWDEMDVR